MYGCLCWIYPPFPICFTFQLRCAHCDKCELQPARLCLIYIVLIKSSLTDCGYSVGGKQDLCSELLHIILFRGPEYRLRVINSIDLYREYAIAIQDEVGDSNGGNV